MARRVHTAVRLDPEGQERARMLATIRQVPMAEVLRQAIAIGLGILWDRARGYDPGRIRP